MKTIYHVIFCLLAVFLGIGPLGYAIYTSTILPLHIVAGINFIAWLAVCLLVASRFKMLAAVDKSFELIGLPTVEGALEVKLSNFLRESQRYHTAAYAFRAEGRVGRNDLGKNLRHIVQLAYDQLGAESAELSLSNSDSGLWSQAMIIGSPRSLASQSLLVEAANETRSEVPESEQVLVQSLTFAGTNFGVLRVELPPGRTATKADYQVLYLLATQGAIMLIDARFTDEILRMKRTSEESIQAKTGFLANLSHEIRGPLGIILNGVELLIEGLCGPITEAQKDTCRMVKNNGEHLLDLVNDVLDYAKVEAGKVTAKPLDILVKPLLSDLATVVRSQAMAKKHKLVVEPIDESLGVSCDKRHIRQVLINFLTNAIKYTPDGGEITVRAQRHAGNRVKLSVTDTGIGIPEQERHKVFGAFERVENEYALQQVGTGLGMPLACRLAEVNGGSVDFESESGKGSTFWISLPAIHIEPIKVNSEPRKDGERIEPQGNGEAILLVDHDVDARQMLERYLVHQGFAIVNATSGSEVMKALRDKPIHLAVVESDMPGLPGEEMVAVIRSNPKAAKVPIIMLSSKAFVFDIERFLKLGVDRCLSKPVELSELAVTARRLIDETRTIVV